jgi:malate synthase
MEDAATAEISRSQVWQWLHHGAALEDGRIVTSSLVRSILDEELRPFAGGRFAEARALFERLATAPALAPFLTLPAYQALITLEDPKEETCPLP